MQKLTDKEIYQRWLEMPIGYRYTYREIDRHHQTMRFLLRTLVGMMVVTQVLLIVQAIAH
jgi:hypothetical protein